MQGKEEFVFDYLVNMYPPSEKSRVYLGRRYAVCEGEIQVVDIREYENGEILEGNFRVRESWSDNA